MKSMTKREKILLIFLIIMLLGFGYFKFFLDPMKAKIAAAEASISTEEAMINQNMMTAKKIKEMEQAIEDIKASGDYREAPSYNNDTLLMKELNIILSAANSYSLGFGKISKTDSVAARPTTLNFTTNTYDEARAILDELNESSNVNTIGDISVTLNTDNAGVGSVSVYCSITYYELLA